MCSPLFFLFKGKWKINPNTRLLAGIGLSASSQTQETKQTICQKHLCYSTTSSGCHDSCATRSTRIGLWARNSCGTSSSVWWLYWCTGERHDANHLCNGWDVVTRSDGGSVIDEICCSGEWCFMFVDVTLWICVCVCLFEIVVWFMLVFNPLRLKGFGWSTWTISSNRYIIWCRQTCHGGTRSCERSFIYY